MVYCGKASQGCQSCRTRRIKCDKKKPECSQCIRVGKKCPGYRDQLSLMFRDESTKVIQKAHAQWGTAESPGNNSHSSSTTSPSVQTTWSAAPTPASGSVGGSPAPEYPTPDSSVVTRRVIPTKIPRRVEPNLEQKGLKFYIDRYLMNHPDSPRTNAEIQAYCSGADATQNIMIAVGLAGMSNLLGNKTMNWHARSKHVTALKQTSQLIMTAGHRFDAISHGLRSIVTLALFEVVQGKGSTKTAGSANTHINGAIALLRSVLPVPGSPNGGARGALQLMFSMFIPSQMTETPLSPAFFDCLKACRPLLEGLPESCCVDLALAIARLIQMQALVQHSAFTDGEVALNDAIQQLLIMENVFEGLEGRLKEAYPFMENKGSYPAQALFRGKWHTYNEIWGARIWNHFRWARILLNQSVIKLMLEFPISSERYISPAQRIRCYAVIERMAEDTLVSTPSHWHHPILDNATARKFEASGQGGSGAVGLPTLLWHLTVAGTAPNVAPEFWAWAYDILQVVWKDMGMQHALSLAEVMDDHRRKQETEALEKSIKKEEGQDEW
ncbi:hypothetical protein F4780DRAFT_99344 [Xylariomycetidae sp. FL0641]|nr:hypothetical protein F4780DRAFT_99344 [Xylariomycetidae sp. FL0641]